MNDHEIHECIDRKNEENYQRIEGLVTSITTFISEENTQIKKSINELTKKVEEQNGSVSDLNEWKAGLTGHELGIKDANEARQKKKLNAWQITGIISAIVVGSIVSIGGVNSLVQKAKEKKAKLDKVEMWMNLWDFSPVTRGGKPILDTTKFKIGVTKNIK